MQAPDVFPDAVRIALEQWCEQRRITPQGDASLATTLGVSWDAIMGCYCFIYRDIFYGIELSGYIHT